MGEFELIERYFARPDKPLRRGTLGIGDDCALLTPEPGMQWAVSTDMLVEGRHFLPTVPPERLGHKALAVNLSDLAACGAEPVAFTFAWALPRADEAFVAPLARGLFALADAHRIELVGGDTTAGPLNLCITVFGQVPAGQALLRSGAKVDDQVWVSGRLGDARLALEAFRGTVNLPGPAWAAVRDAMELPQPRVALGMALRGIASSAIDLSDGLVGDLGHVLERSAVAATLEHEALPRSEVLAQQPASLQTECLLAGGDDYELLFTAPPEREREVRAAAERSGCTVTRIGRILAGRGLQVLDREGRPMPLPRGFDHFMSP